jgi:hypothetical protein
MNRLLLTLFSLAAASLARAQNADEMAKQVANPIASLTSVPVQFNDEYDAGSNGDGHRLRINVQPVVPISIGASWNLISRTIVPIIRQEDMRPGAGEQSGLGDATQSLFFSPKALTAGGWSWGVGPVFLLPTASDPLLGAIAGALARRSSRYVRQPRAGPTAHSRITSHRSPATSNAPTSTRHSCSRSSPSASDQDAPSR